MCFGERQTLRADGLPHARTVGLAVDEGSFCTRR
ncbi:MAG: hypothetical protein ACI9YM_002647, partial [Brevundimonas sp.]